MSEDKRRLYLHDELNGQTMEVIFSLKLTFKENIELIKELIPFDYEVFILKSQGIIINDSDLLNGIIDGEVILIY